jgi:GntR family transcriptional regulator
VWTTLGNDATFTSIMLWTLDPNGRQGLAVQVAAQVRRGLVEGELSAGDLLPSSAELAAVLGVNANTVLAAYRSLRDEGLLEFRRGRGVRVCRDAVHDAKVLKAAREFAEVAAEFGYTAENLPELLRRAGATR